MKDFPATTLLVKYYDLNELFYVSSLVNVRMYAQISSSRTNSFGIKAIQQHFEPLTLKMKVKDINDLTGV